jgi:hypothetical protein
VKKIKIIFKSANITLNAELFDTPTGQKVWEVLPHKTPINTWGEEIYFDISLTLSLEPGARKNVEVGEIGYWDVGKSMCLFWGRTPASKGKKPVAASPVTIFGKIIGDATVLSAVEDGAEVIVEKVE